MAKTKSKSKSKDDEKDGPFFVKSERTLGRIIAAEAYAAKKEHEKQQLEAGTAPLNLLPDQPYLDVVLTRAEEYGYSIGMEDMKAILEVIEKQYLTSLFRAVDSVAEQVDIEYRNWKDPEHPMAGPSKVLLDRSRRAQAALRAAETAKEVSESASRSKKRKTAAVSTEDVTSTQATMRSRPDADLDSAVESLAKKPRCTTSKHAAHAGDTSQNARAKQHALNGENTDHSDKDTLLRTVRGAQRDREYLNRQCKYMPSQAQSEGGQLVPAGGIHATARKAPGTAKTAQQPTPESRQSSASRAKTGRGGKSAARGGGRAKSKG